MASNFDGMARMIVQNVGGKDNVAGLRPGSRCLIFDLKDDGRANTAIMQSISGVTKVSRENGKYVVEVEGPIQEIYTAVCDKGQIDSSAYPGGAAPGNGSMLPWIVGILAAFTCAWFVLPLLNPQASVWGRVIIGIAASVASSIIVALISRKQSKLSAKTEKESERQNDEETAFTEEISAPVRGRVVNLPDIPDESFASGALGKGIGILPAEGRVYAPCDGTITTFFPTGHAIGISSSKGAEVLMHIGLGTVSMNGDGFEPKKNQGDSCKKGELLLEFDIARIKQAGLNPITPVIIANSQEYEKIVPTSKSEAALQDIVLSLKK